MAPDSRPWALAGGVAVALLATGAGGNILPGLDANRNGQIDLGEWRGAYVGMGAAPISRSDFATHVAAPVASPLFTLWDLNGDDRLSAEEWDRAFGLMDADHDDLVTQDEVEAEVARSAP